MPLLSSTNGQQRHQHLSSETRKRGDRFVAAQATTAQARTVGQFDNPRYTRPFHQRPDAVTPLLLEPRTTVYGHLDNATKSNRPGSQRSPAEPAATSMG
jgi:hypothetical protein